MKRKVQIRYLVPIVTAAAALSLSGAAIAADPSQSGQSSLYGQQMGSRPVLAVWFFQPRSQAPEWNHSLD